jgi:colanic acid biosynthesis glycosyl transferase WcaI
MAARVLERLDRLVVSRATTVVVISESFRKIYLRRGVPDRRLHLVPNWVDRKSIKPDADGRRIRQKLSIPEKAFLTVYGGNIAAAAGVEAAIEAFSKLEDKAEMYFCIAGEGANLEGCRQLAQRLGCERVRFHAPWEVEETSEMLAAADLLLLPTRAEQSIASVPSKLIAYMLAARPVLALAVKGSDVAMTIEKAEAGWVIAPGDEKALLSRWCEIAQMDRASLAWHGKAAREYALLNMTSDICLPRLLDLVEQAGSS